MTSPDPGSTRPGRIAGVALLGLAAVALVIGLITALGGTGDNNADNGRGGAQPSTRTTAITGPPAHTGTSAHPTTTHRPSTTTAKTTTGGAPPPTTTTGQAQQSPGGDGNGEPAKSVPVRVLNNGTIKGLAARAAADLRASGWNVTGTGNYSGGIIWTTTVYYRPGTEEEATARAIATEFGMRVLARFEGIQAASPGVIVIVTDDYGNKGGDGKGK
ncbi:LytR C-terminal domain-containing protein [Actinophytocola sp.]|uniref:LytR C-terminal domain-containing protein n=1 Tax=Actinophytocola sp. TaxID=1872138 RepID=UPI003899FE45